MFGELISIQQIDLGRAFKDSEEFYRPELAFLFPYASRVAINEFLDHENGEDEFVHLETVPASSAVMPILTDNPHSSVVLRCSMPSANVTVILDLLGNGVFDRLDTVIVEANGSEVLDLLDIFATAGLHVWEHQRISGSSDKILAGSRDPNRFDNGEFIRIAGQVSK